MDKTILAAFDNPQDVQPVISELTALGIDRRDIELVDQTRGTSFQMDATDTTQRRGLWGGFMNWLHDLGAGSNDSDTYAECVRRGGAVLAIHTYDDTADPNIVAGILESHGAIDIDQRLGYYKQEGFTSFDDASEPYTADQAISERERFAPGGKFAIPVVEEQVNVGKRKMNTGIVRVFDRLTERPVEQDVRLRDEYVEVERRKVDRPATAEDLKSFEGGTMEMAETTEVPVVNKEARVTEEVIVNKTSEEHVETIHETARRRDVDVERSTDSPNLRR